MRSNRALCRVATRHGHEVLTQLIGKTLHMCHVDAVIHCTAESSGSRRSILRPYWCTLPVQAPVIEVRGQAGDVIGAGQPHEPFCLVHAPGFTALCSCCARGAAAHGLQQQQERLITARQADCQPVGTACVALLSQSGE